MSVINPGDGGDGGGGTGSGGGTGGGAVSASGAPVGSASSFVSSGAGTWDLEIVRKTADVAACGPDYRLAADEFVEVAALPGNTKVVGVSTVGPSAAKVGPRMTLAAGSPVRQLSVRNLADIWTYGEVVGEGVGVTVRKRQ